MGLAGPTVSTSLQIPPYLSPVGAGAVVVADGAVVAVGALVVVVGALVVVAGAAVVVVSSPQATSSRLMSVTSAIRINNDFLNKKIPP